MRGIDESAQVARVPPALGVGNPNHALRRRERRCWEAVDGRRRPARLHCETMYAGFRGTQLTCARRIAIGPSPSLLRSEWPSPRRRRRPTPAAPAGAGNSALCGRAWASGHSPPRPTGAASQMHRPLMDLGRRCISPRGSEDVPGRPGLWSTYVRARPLQVPSVLQRPLARRVGHHLAAVPVRRRHAQIQSLAPSRRGATQAQIRTQSQPPAQIFAFVGPGRGVPRVGASECLAGGRAWCGRRRALEPASRQRVPLRGGFSRAANLRGRRPDAHPCCAGAPAKPGAGLRAVAAPISAPRSCTIAFILLRAQ